MTLIARSILIMKSGTVSFSEVIRMRLFSKIDSPYVSGFSLVIDLLYFQLLILDFQDSLLILIFSIKMIVDVKKA